MNHATDAAARNDGARPDTVHEAHNDDALTDERIPFTLDPADEPIPYALTIGPDLDTVADVDADPLARGAAAVSLVRGAYSPAIVPVMSLADARTVVRLAQARIDGSTPPIGHDTTVHREAVARVVDAIDAAELAR